METHPNKKDSLKRKRNNNGLGFAVFLIFFGCLYLLINTGVIPKEYKSILISWQMLLIAIGAWNLIRGQYGAALVLILIGGIFIYPKLTYQFPDYFFDLQIDFHTYWPIALIIIGAALLFKKYSSSDNSKSRRNIDDEYRSENYSSSGEIPNASFNRVDFIDKNIMFSGSRQIVLSQNFEGGDNNVMFGELVIDLRKAKLAKGTNKLEINVAFGGATVYVPSDWDVELQSSVIFGSFEDKRYITGNEVIDRSSRLIIKTSCIFGGGELKN